MEGGAMLEFAVIDDEAFFCHKINQLIDSSLFSSELQYKVKSFNTIATFLDACHHNTFDLLFLDIEIGNQNGLELAKLLKERESNTIIIYVSAHDNYMKLSFGLNVYGYILKQEMDKDLPKLLISAITDLTAIKSINFHTDNGIETFMLNNIQFFEYTNRKIFLNTSNAKVQIHISSLSKVKDLLNSDFMSPNANFIINMHSIRHINKSGKITLHNNTTEFQISYGKIRKLTDLYKAFLIKEVS